LAIFKDYLEKQFSKQNMVNFLDNLEILSYPHNLRGQFFD